jgi:hypothetical protein
VETKIHKIEAMVLFVQDLAGRTAFYRDTFKLQYQGSDADSASFPGYRGKASPTPEGSVLCS